MAKVNPLQPKLLTLLDINLPVYFVLAKAEFLLEKALTDDCKHNPNEN